MEGNLADGVVGRDHVVALVAELVERPRSGDRPLPIVVLAGPGGSGKTRLLDHLERAGSPDLPRARVNLTRDPNATSCRVVLDVVYEQLRDYDHPQFGRLRLRRYELGRAMRSQAPQDGDDGDRGAEHALTGFVGRLRRRWKVPTDDILAGSVPSRAVRLAFGWLLRLLVPTSLVVRRGPLRRMLWGRRDDAAMGWYESQAGRMRLPAGSRIDRVAAAFARPSGEVGGGHDRTLADELLLDALLVDLRESYLRRAQRRYRTGYCLLLIDDADLLPAAAGQNFLRLLADRRRAREWDPLVVVATKQGGLAEEVGTGPDPNGGADDRAGPDDRTGADGGADDRAGADGGADRLAWARRFRHDPEPNPYLPVRLHRLTEEQTRRLVSDLVSPPAVNESGLVLSEEMHRVSRGHPLAVRLLTEALRAEHVRWPARELPSARSRMVQPMALPPPDALPEETVGDYLRRRMLQRVTELGEYQRLSDELLLCGAARRLDTGIVRMLLTRPYQPDSARRARAERWLDQVAEYSFTESIDGDAVLFHPLLRDLLAARLVATGTGERSSYRLVHHRLREHFEPATRTGDDVALAEYLYHCLALGDVRPLVDLLATVLTDRTARSRERWLRLLRSATEAPMPGRLPTVAADPHPVLHRLRDLLGPDRPRREAETALERAVLYLWLIRSCTSEARLDEPLLEAALAAARALPGSDRRDSLARDLVRELEELLRHATGERAPEPLPARSALATPGYRMTLRRVRPSRRTRRRAGVSAVLVPCLAFAGWFGFRFADYRMHACAPTDALSALRGGGDSSGDSRVVTRVADGQCVGITDGSFPFSDFAAPYERRILAQNEEVARRASHGQPFVTVVVTAMLTSDDKVSPQKDIGSGVNELEGAYLAQRQYDTGGDPKLARTPNPLLRVLIANVGGKSRQAELTARKIVDLSRREPVAAVTGLPQSRPQTLAAVRLLGAAGIPMVASVTSGDAFRGLDHFFRVAPSNDREAVALADFARSRFPGRTVWLLGDESDQYSANLSEDVSRELARAGVAVALLRYTADSADTNNQIRFAVAQACTPPTRADPLIVYTGRANELGTVFGALTDLLCSGATMLSGDDVSSLQAPPNEGFPVAASGRLYFTAFGLDQATWLRLHQTSVPPSFYREHSRFFPRDEVNGHVIAAYDAAGVVIDAIRTAKLNASDLPVSGASVYRALRNKNGDSAYPGVGGTLDFDATGEPRDKLVVINRVTAPRDVHYETALGTP